MFGRHLEVRIVVPDRFQEQAAGVAADDGRAGVAAGGHAGPGIEVEPGAQFFRRRGMAVVAFSAQDGLDFLAEEFVTSLDFRSGVGGTGGGHYARKRQRASRDAEAWSGTKDV